MYNDQKISYNKVEPCTLSYGETNMFDAIEAKIKDTRVLEALLKVPRNEFIPEEYGYLADQDCPLPIGYAQTISQPLIVALMTELLELRSTDRVLEIGTGSGYQTAILAEIVQKVYTIEVVRPLAERGRAALAALGYQNIDYRVDDGFPGWPEEAPYDAIIVAAAAEEIPQPLVRQLADGGRMVIPLGVPDEVQTLWKISKSGEQIKQEKHGLVRFVPFVREERH
jgi:protein-L-isoaspartate(D-aspartate) O-methyltransferase